MAGSLLGLCVRHGYGFVLPAAVVIVADDFIIFPMHFLLGNI